MGNERSTDASIRSPLRIGRRDPTRITFEWRDGVENAASAAEIRRGCPCAHCVDEHTGRPLLDPTTVRDDLTHTSVELVGNYALGLVFSDGHRTGIFTWVNLRRIAEASALS
ncbi:MAG: DUF971 domain-containing protein [Planctomycetota bacterium]